MKLDLTQLGAYELKQERELSDIHSQGYYLIHKKSGARVLLAENADENKVFSIAFRTPPCDSTGTPHIIEHTVLCGSEKFPVKDPFIELLKGSMNTFLNAMTYPDKTMYPVASCNDADFQNLMNVYMDSVFHPNIYKEENIFRQEGWHYELEAPEDELKLNGVVYNEMKGAFSSADSVLEREILNALYPDTPYQYESGGDPDVIPELTYEKYLDFHRTYYHPSNSYIYLYGDMDMTEKLKWLDEEYLSGFERMEVHSEIALQKPFDEPKRLERTYSIASTESTRDHTYLSYSWSVGTNLDPQQYIAFEMLDYALLTTQGAPIKQALLDAGIGEDIYGGYDNSTLQPIYSIIAKGANPEDQDRFIEIIRNVLKEQVKNGLNKKTLLAAINGSEFKFREADFGRFPKGLMYGIQVMDSWLYDEDQPFLHLESLSVYEKLRKLLETDYFEGLIQTFLLDNTHAVAVRVTPQQGLTADREQALKEKLQAYKASLTPEELKALVDETHALAQYQEEPSPQEDIEKIPLLTKEDMKKVCDPYSNVEESIGGVPCLWHDYQTNGIVYLDLLFDAHHIEEELVPYLALLTGFLGKLDTADYSYQDFADEVNLYTGGIRPELNVTGSVAKSGEYQVKFEVRIRTLRANLAKAIELAKSMMLRTSFTDEKRIYEILAQAKSRMQSELSEGGHIVSMNRAMSYYSPRSRYADMIQGLSFYRMLERLTADYENEKADLREKLQAVTERIFTRKNLLVSCTGEAEDLQLVQGQADAVTAGLFADREEKRAEISLPETKNEGFMDASQIQYVSLAGNYRIYDERLPYTGALRIFKTIMSYEYLWQNIRVRGGAYGCMCSVGRGGDIAFCSYRDPNLSRTLEVYRGVADYLKTFELDERTMRKYVIGTFSEMDAPLTPLSMGRRSLLAYLSDTSWEMIQRDREEVLAARQEDIRALAAQLSAVLEHSYICAIGNEEKLTEEASLFEHTEYLVRSQESE